MKLTFVSMMLVLAPTLVMAAPLAPKAIDGAVIVRVDKRDKSLSVAATGKKLATAKDATKVLSKIKFAKVAKENQNLGELDREAGASSWYCNYSPYYNNNSLYWYGYNYRPYYRYQYQNYDYYYYSSYYNGYSGGNSGGYPGYGSYNGGYNDDYNDDYNGYSNDYSDTNGGWY